MANFVASAFNSPGFEFVPGFAQVSLPESRFHLSELAFGALGVADVARGLLVRPAVLPRLAQAAGGGLAGLNSPLGKLAFHGCLE